MIDSFTEKGAEGRAKVPVRWHQIGTSCRTGNLKCQKVCVDEGEEVSGTETENKHSSEAKSIMLTGVWKLICLARPGFLYGSKKGCGCLGKRADEC